MPSALPCPARQGPARLSGTMHDDVPDSKILELAFRATGLGLWDWEVASNQIYLSAAFRSLTGLPVDGTAVSPDTWISRIHPKDRLRWQDTLAQYMAGRRAVLIFDHRIRTITGEFRWVRAWGLAERANDGRVIRIAGALADIGEHKRAEQALLHASVHDPLTGLANRLMLRDRLEQALVRHQGNPLVGCTLFVFDLDRFKVVNDGLGQAIGDRVLREVGRRLKTAVGNTAVVARLAADEFALVGESTPIKQDLAGTTEKLLAVLGKPFAIGRHSISITASIGAAQSGSDTRTADDLFRDADLALVAAKQQGGGRAVLFDEALRQSALRRLNLENDLQDAIARNAFCVHYQPVVRMTDGALVGFEALLRWFHPTLGPISPEEFIPIAEETGLIGPLGIYVLRTACAQLKSWHRNFAEAGHLTIGVNVSLLQMREQTLPAMVDRILTETGLNGTSLHLEITETAMVEAPAETARQLNAIKRLGVRIFVDDFGTGYSSLSHLHRLPLDALKIDRSFVFNMAQSESHHETVRAITALAGAFHMGTIAEGVETTADALSLLKLGCTHAQGFLFSRALAPPEAEAVIRSPPWRAPLSA